MINKDVADLIAAVKEIPREWLENWVKKQPAWRAQEDEWNEMMSKFSRAALKVRGEEKSKATLLAELETIMLKPIDGHTYTYLMFREDVWSIRHQLRKFRK